MPNLSPHGTSMPQAQGGPNPGNLFFLLNSLRQAPPDHPGGVGLLKLLMQHLGGGQFSRSGDAPGVSPGIPLQDVTPPPSHNPQPGRGLLPGEREAFGGGNTRTIPQAPSLMDILSQMKT